MKQLTNPDIVNLLTAEHAAHLHMDEYGNLTIHRAAGWVVAPLPGGTHLSVDDQKHILSLCAAQPELRLWALPIEQLPNSPGVIEVNPDTRDLLEFNRTLSFLDYSLLATNADATSVVWILACFSNDYLIALGPKALVERLIGGSVRSAFAAFSKYAEDPGWKPEIRSMLRDVATQLLQYADAEPGAGIPLRNTFRD
jgi:hypothetical protein